MSKLAKPWPVNGYSFDPLDQQVDALGRPVEESADDAEREDLGLPRRDGLGESDQLADLGISDEAQNTWSRRRASASVPARVSVHVTAAQSGSWQRQIRFTQIRFTQIRFTQISTVARPDATPRPAIVRHMTDQLAHRFAATTITSLMLVAGCAGADADAPQPRDDAAPVPTTIQISGSTPSPAD